VRYRAEIDGLRAVALIPVILFHARFDWFSGGYVGVDVFFVISGYLITSLILVEKEAGTFTLRNFYERRARRIIPALFFVTVACIVPAWLWMMPSQLRDFAQSVVALALFSSNILFWRKGDYFLATADDMPLLHTWSIAVEEQYYVVFPILMLLLWSIRRRRLIALIAIAAATSLLLSEYGWRHHPGANFYLAPTRAWELMLGVLAAFYLHAYAHSNRTWLNQTASLGGFGLIIVAVTFFDRNTPVPSLLALIPTLGTVLVICFGDKTTLVGKLLSTRALVGIGLVSYSAYLWHHPLFAFARIRSLDEPGLWLYATLCAVTFVLAYLTWKYVERPFRERRILSSGQVFSVAALSSTALIAIGLVGHLNRGFEERVDSRVLALSAYEGDTNPRMTECRSGGSRLIPPRNACIYGTNPVPRIALWGDSHADQLAVPLEQLVRSKSESFIELAYAGCPPMIDVFRIDSPESRCAEYNSQALSYLLETRTIDTVVMHAYWTGYIDDGLLRVDARGNPVPAPIAEQLSSVVQRLRLAGKKVILIFPVPKMPSSPPQYLAKKLMFTADVGDVFITMDEYVSQSKKSFATLSPIARSQRVEAVYPHMALCDVDANRCSATDGDRVLYRDNGHVSITGARRIVPLLQRGLGY